MQERDRHMARWLIMTGCIVAISIASIILRTPTDPIRIEPWDPVLGDAEAPITIVMFHDYECPYCKEFLQENYHTIVSEWVGTGKARFVIKPYIKKGEAMGAEGGLCANEQDAFWAFNEKMLGMNLITKQALLRIAEEEGLDLERFETCIDERATQAATEENLRYGNELGIARTPTIYVNGLKIGGKPSPADFTSVLHKFRT